MNKWLTALIVLIVIYLLGSIAAFFLFGENDGAFTNKIMIVPISGTIVSTDSGDDFFGSGVVSSKTLVDDIKELDRDDSVKGIIFEIDSPGGTAVASKEIADAIKNLTKPNYALIREVGASGAYWVASASDKIIASPISITGSIGVIAGYLEFSGLFEKYGVNYERLVSGKYKDVGTPYRELTDDERDLLQRKIDMIHEYFIQEVASNRDMDVNYVRNLSTGEFFLGEEALELGLIDKLGNRDTAIELMKNELNDTEID